MATVEASRTTAAAMTMIRVRPPVPASAPPPAPPRSAKSPHRPRDHDEQPDQRQVGVALRHRLLPDLNDADHRDEHAEEPEPPDRQIAMPPPEPDDRRRRRQQRDQCQWPVAQRRLRDVVRIRIEDRQIRRPDGFDEVLDVRDERIREPRPERALFDRRHRAALALHDVRDDARHQRDADQRQFFHDQPRPASRRRAPAARSRAAEKRTAA